MIRRAIDDEGGYSLVEVVAAIMILSIAIIPMVGMFDAGLRAAVTGSNYDRARSIAGEELEEIKALPFRRDGAPADSAVELFPSANGPAPPPSGSTSCSPPIETGFDCRVEINYLSPRTLVLDGGARTMMSVKVTVTWAGGGPYSTTGLISKGTL